MSAASSARCQSARAGPSTSGDRLEVASKSSADVVEGQRRREDADMAFSTWLRQKQREAAARRRHEQSANDQTNNEVFIHKIVTTTMIHSFIEKKRRVHTQPALF